MDFFNKIENDIISLNNTINGLNIDGLSNFIRTEMALINKKIDSFPNMNGILLGAKAIEDNQILLNKAIITNEYLSIAIIVILGLNICGTLYSIYAIGSVKTKIDAIL